MAASLLTRHLGIRGDDAFQARQKVPPDCQPVNCDQRALSLSLSLSEGLDLTNLQGRALSSHPDKTAACGLSVTATVPCTLQRCMHCGRDSSLKHVHIDASHRWQTVMESKWTHVKCAVVKRLRQQQTFSITVAVTALVCVLSLVPV